MIRLGVVSFLNARPLIEGLDARPDVQLVPDVPARLAERLQAGQVDAALVPVIDILRSRGSLRVVSDACIGCEGETMTVRVFSQVPPDRIRTLAVDADSHTSVALARVLWRELYGVELELRPLGARGAHPNPAREGGADPNPTREHAAYYPTTDVVASGVHAGECEPALLLIGDKVVDPRRGSFAYEVDLGGAWRQHTGLPFVFAAWARCSPETDSTCRAENEPEACASSGMTTLVADAELAELLECARDRGVARAREIAEREAAAHGWPAALAVRYLTRCLKFRMDARFVQGANAFAAKVVEAGLAERGSQIGWPGALLASVS